MLDFTVHDSTRDGSDTTHRWRHTSNETEIRDLSVYVAKVQRRLMKGVDGRAEGEICCHSSYHIEGGGGGA